jgi:hypothetical protein
VPEASSSADFQPRTCFRPADGRRGLGYVLTGSLVGAFIRPVLITGAQALADQHAWDPLASVIGGRVRAQGQPDWLQGKNLTLSPAVKKEPPYVPARPTRLVACSSSSEQGARR